jgi:hypothetical protein
VYSPVKSGTVTYVILVLLDGSTAAAKVVRCYQCSAGLTGAEANLSRVTVSAEDKAFTAKLELTGIPGQQIGAQEKTLRAAAVPIPIMLPRSSEDTLRVNPQSLSNIATSEQVTKTVTASAISVGNL